MAPGQFPRPTRQPSHQPAARPNPRPNHAGARPPPQQAYLTYQPLRDMQHEFWLRWTMDAFNHLILFGESQPSNGTVRKVFPPNGETTFAIAYGDAPDKDLRELLEIVCTKHGEVVLGHDGRDSTGKHWITCFSQARPGTFEPPILKAIICVFSKLEMATVPRPSTIPNKGKGKATRYGKEGPPKVAGAVKGAPKHLASLPWRQQLQRLEPAAAKALRDRMEAEAFESDHRTLLCKGCGKRGEVKDYLNAS